MRELLEQIERGQGEPAAALVFLARQELALDEGELRAATRRALLVLAAGGDPHRDLSLNDRAVASLARDLDSGPARRELAAALSALRGHAAGLPRVGGTLDRLLSDVETAWLWLALVLLADGLAGDHSIE